MELIYYYINPKKKKLEELFAWAQFYQNSPNLAIPTKPNEQMFKKTQIQIEGLMKEFYRV